MKFILNKDKLIIEDKEKPNSGSVKYYEAEVEFDESWNDLTKEIIIVPKECGSYSNIGTSSMVINNKVFIDKSLSGFYGIGFIGYTIENEEKTYQISTNLQSIHFRKGAGEIEISDEDVPTPTQWEIYYAQIQELIQNIPSSPSGGGSSATYDNEVLIFSHGALVNNEVLEV